MGASVRSSMDFWSKLVWFSGPVQKIVVVYGSQCKTNREKKILKKEKEKTRSLFVRIGIEYIVIYGQMCFTERLLKWNEVKDTR